MSGSYLFVTRDGRFAAAARALAAVITRELAADAHVKALEALLP